MNSQSIFNDEDILDSIGGDNDVETLKFEKNRQESYNSISQNQLKINEI